MRAKAKCLALISAITMLVLFGGSALGASISVSIDDATGSPESKTEVPIDLAGASNVGAMDIVLTYDPSVLSASSVEKGELTKDSMLESNKSVPGIIAIAIADTRGINGDGSVAIIAFDVVGQLETTSPLTLEDVKANDVNTFTDILVTTTSGTFTITEKGVPLSPMMIGIIALVIILIAVGVIFAVRRRRKVA
jgi:hypothetical protein